MTEKAPGPIQADAALVGWGDGHASGSIEVFEWALLLCDEVKTVAQVKLAVGQELDRRYPKPNPRRTV